MTERRLPKGSGWRRSGDDEIVVKFSLLWEVFLCAADRVICTREDARFDFQSRKVWPRTSAWYPLYVEATRRNLILPDLPDVTIFSTISTLLWLRLVHVTQRWNQPYSVYDSNASDAYKHTTHHIYTYIMYADLSTRPSMHCLHCRESWPPDVLSRAT
jgi:hypothetical protein